MSLDDQIDDLCDKFRAAWKAGKPPAICKVLSRTPVKQHGAILEQLVPVDVECRTNHGLSPEPGDYAEFGLAAVELATRKIEYLASATNSMTPEVALNEEMATGNIDGLEDDGRRMTESQILDAFHKVTKPSQSSPVIGPYKILQKIGEGGMGLVFMAEQMHPVRRRVALKLIKAGMDTKEIITRFEAERQALALMDHPNIAKVLDAGTTTDGRPYFVMELVQGIPITDYCDRNKLAIEERLALFSQTCRAIQHAHQKGIIHRDIKPSNVMVTQHDGLPSVKVIDFGLAKALQAATRLTDKTMFTEFGKVLGTFQYMSPEQAETNALDVDTRSDVYSLGVLLYELLTGSTPIEEQRLKEMALDRILVAIREQEAPRPSMRLSSLGEHATTVSEQRRTDTRKLSIALKGDLDWIAMKALEKDRNRRYDSPLQLAEDVARYLNQDAIVARPPSLTYRLRKTFRRNKLAAASVSTILCVLLVGISGTTWAMFRARDAETAARKETDRALDAELRESQEKAYALDQASLAREEASKARTAEDLAKKESSRAREAEQREAEEKANALAQAERASLEANKAKLAEDIAKKETRRALDAEMAARESEARERLARTELTQQQEVVAAERDRARAERDRAVSAEESAEATLARSNYFLAVSRWEQNRVSEAITLLHQIPFRHRHFEWNLTNRQFGGGDLTLNGHDGIVWSVSFSPDGKSIVSGGSGGQMRLWDAVTGEEKRRFIGHFDNVRSLCFSPDGKRIVSGSWDSTLKLWDAISGGELQTLKGHSSIVSSVTFSPDGTRIASAGWDEMLKLWDADTGAEIRTFGRQSEVVHVADFSPDGTTIVSGGGDGTLKLWDVDTGRELRVFPGHSNVVSSVRFSPDGMRIVSGSWDSTLKLWNATSGEELRTFFGHSHYVGCASFSPDGQTIISGGGDNTVKIWNANTGAEVQRLIGHTSQVEGVTFSPDGARIASAGWDGTLKLWDSTTVGETRRLFRGSFKTAPSEGEAPAEPPAVSISARQEPRPPGLETATGNYFPITCLRFSPDGTKIAACDEAGRLSLWDVKTQTELQTFSGHIKEAFCLSFSPDGRRLISGSADGTLKLWEVNTGADVRTFSGHSNAVAGVCFSPDGSRIVSGSRDATVKLWDASTGEELRSLNGHSKAIAIVSFSPDGTQIISGSNDNSLALWDTASGERLRQFVGHSLSVSSACFSADGRRIVSGSGDNTVRIWDVATGAELHRLGHSNYVTHNNQSSSYHSGVLGSSFNEDATRILSSGRDGTLRLWDTNSGEELWTHIDESRAVTSANFSPDGLQIACGRADGSVKIWDSSHRNEERILFGHSKPVRKVAFCSVGDRTYLRSLDEGEQELYWQPETGEQVNRENESTEFGEWHDSISPDGRWMAVPMESLVRLIDLHYKHTPDEKTFREAKARPKPGWHRQQATVAESHSDCYASLFHRAWLVKISQSDKAAVDAFRAAYQKLLDANGGKAPPVPPAVKEALAIAESMQHGRPE